MVQLTGAIDLLTFAAGTIFRLEDGRKPLDIPVKEPISVLLEEKLWLHSVDWKTPELKNALIQSFS
jgi:hypothetical protein